MDGERGMRLASFTSTLSLLLDSLTGPTLTHSSLYLIFGPAKRQWVLGLGVCLPRSPRHGVRSRSLIIDHSDPATASIAKHLMSQGCTWPCAVQEQEYSAPNIGQAPPFGGHFEFSSSDLHQSLQT